MVFKTNISFGYIRATDPIAVRSPSARSFFEGGINSIRGYVLRSISPTLKIADTREPNAPILDFPVGGNKELVTNWEVEFPLIGSAGLRGVGFYDAGNVFSEKENLFPELAARRQSSPRLVPQRRLRHPLVLAPWARCGSRSASRSRAALSTTRTCSSSPSGTSSSPGRRRAIPGTQEYAAPPMSARSWLRFPLVALPPRLRHPPDRSTPRDSAAAAAAPKPAESAPPPPAPVAPDTVSPASSARVAELAGKAQPLVDAFLNSEALLRPRWQAGDPGLQPRRPSPALRGGCDPAGIAGAAPAGNDRAGDAGRHHTPDGKAVLFRADHGADEKWSIWKINLDGSGAVEITQGEPMQRDAAHVADLAPETVYFSARRISDASSALYAAPLAAPGAPREVYRDAKPALLRTSAATGSRPSS